MSTSCLQTPTQYSLDITLAKFATFETFIDTNGGKLLSELKQLIQLSSNLQVEPHQYLIWGSKGTGKTHLLQAICNQCATLQQSAVYLPMQELVQLNEKIVEDMHQYDVICIDDIEMVMGKELWDRQLFNLINELRANYKSLVMTSSLNPNAIEVSIPDLASRLVWGPVYKLNILEDAEKEKAIQAHAKARGLEISAEVCSYLFKRFSRGLDNLISLLDELDKQSIIQQRKVTVPFVKSILETN